MSWLVKILLDWGLAKIIELGAWLLSKFKRNQQAEEEIKKDEAQADLIVRLSKEVSDLLKAGQPVPKELEDRLREETRKLDLNGSQH